MFQLITDLLSQLMMTANDHQFLLNPRQHDVLTEIQLMEIICIIAIKEENASFPNQLVDGRYKCR
jgi:hypothetical protein